MLILNYEVLLYFLISIESMHVLVHCNEFAVKQQKQKNLGIKNEPQVEMDL